MRKWIKLIIKAVLIGLLIGLNLVIYSGIAETLKKLELKLDIYELDRQQQIIQLEKNLENYEKDNKLQIQEIRNKFKNMLSKDIENIEQIKQANVDVWNMTREFSGSGTHIKINDKSYILTCAHLIKKIDDVFTIDGNIVTLVKYNKKEDLALFEFMIYKNKKDLAYLEISDIFPKIGSQVLVIGNPAGLIDVITNGIIARIEKNYMVLTNTIYLGSSGGAVIYRGKLIGVITNIYYLPPSTSYSIARGLNRIKEFLKGIK